MTINPLLGAILAGLALLAALVLWYALVRPVPVENGMGVVTGGQIEDARVVERTGFRSLRTYETSPRQSTLEIPERFVVRIDLKDLQEEVRFGVAPQEAEEFPVGARVRVWYLTREIPGIWRKVLVDRIELVEDDG